MAGIPFRGVLLDQLTINALQKAEGVAGFHFTLTQGSFNNSVAASAGTHSGGGALDVSVNGMSTQQQVAIVRSLRQAGFAAWRRSPADGFVDHIHAILIGDPQLSAAAAAQVPQYNQGLNGLANHAKDTNPIDVAAGRPGGSGSGNTSSPSGSSPLGLSAGAVTQGFLSAIEAPMVGFLKILLYGLEMAAGAAFLLVGAFLVMEGSKS